MARVRTKKTAMEAIADVKTKPVRVDLSPEVHRLLRLVAADSDMSMAAYARDFLERHLKAEAKSRNIRP
jgi:plasmid stability protein